ncbi:ATP-binding protein [Sporomusa sp.]|uniref:ATP-binding protein n=1 Tax=Sporomusa sp. TaxID=2078658 RepID=UPI002BA7DA83|nr:ATP-binding protein [Sporomusa sp.]HWR45316.1 ATP-binding protein [Sporomusa sp.]
MPYSVSIPWLSPWCYLAGIILRLVIVLGILLVYLEKTRSDLAQKETQYRLLAENAADVIYRYRLSPVANFEYISPAALPVTGYIPEEYYTDASLLTKLIYLDDQPLFDKFVENDSAPSDLPHTFRLVRKDQNIIWVEQKVVPIYDKSGNLVALEGILRDVTARKNMEQVVARAEQMNMVGQMAASVAHEIRNPLTSVRGYLQMMKIKGESSISQERYDLMISELDRTNTVITEYLLLAKDKVPNLRSCCLNSIITAVFPLIQVTAGATSAYIKLFPEEIPETYLDKNEIRQLIFNLVNNGLQAMPKGGELVIRTYMDKDTVVLSISDQGSGIPPQILKNLGTPFLTTKNTGTGLGLPMCYRIAQRHNAAIHVETSDKGTTFLVKFSLTSL